MFEKDPLKIKVGTSFADGLSKGSSQIYAVEYNTEVADESFDFEIDSGSAKLMISLLNPSENSKLEALKMVDLEASFMPVTQTFKIKDFLPKDNKNQTFNFFSKFYIKVVATSEARFIISVNKPSTKYINMIPGQRIDANLSKLDSETAYVYRVNPQSVNSLVIRFRLGTAKKDSNYLEETNAIFNNIDFTYIAEDQFGEVNQTTIKANVIKQYSRYIEGYDFYEASFNI